MTAGLLDGQRATTHWRMCAELGRRFPRVEVNENVLFVDNGRILTSAGAAAGLDLCLHLVRRDHGAAVANAAARACVVAPWREGGQAQFIEQPVPADGDASTSATRLWALERLSEVGQSPRVWVTQRRVDYARQLLEVTELPINEVAAAVGFADPILLRKHLGGSVGLTPNAYRRSYAAPQVDPAS